MLVLRVSRGPKGKVYMRISVYEESQREICEHIIDTVVVDLERAIEIAAEYIMRAYSGDIDVEPIVKREGVGGG